MRVYEWGPEDGEKILFIHGISTSCMTVSKLAQAMVDRGHRVMIFVSSYRIERLLTVSEQTY